MRFGDHWCKVIALLEFGGGAAGLYNLWRQLSEPPESPWVYVLAVVVGAAYVLAVVAGILLWRTKRWGYRLSIAIQLLQLPKISGAHLTFMISFGFDAILMFMFGSNVDGARLSFNFKIGADHAFFINYSEIPLALGFSLLSCFFLLVLFRCLPARHTQPRPAQVQERPNSG